MERPVVINEDLWCSYASAWSDRAAVWGSEWGRLMDVCVRWDPHAPRASSWGMWLWGFCAPLVWMAF